MDFILRDRRDLFMELSVLATLARTPMLTAPGKNKDKDSKTNVAKKKKRKIAEASKAKNRRRK